VRLDFDLRGLFGRVDVTVTPNERPELLGCRPAGRGFPVCTATVSYEGNGYDAMLGWIQLVRSTDGAGGGSRFELDPYEPLGALSHPFCWFGLRPTLFDAPSRESRSDMDWTAHSFLAFVAATRTASAILGFSWGFAIAEGQIRIEPARPLDSAGWDAPSRSCVTTTRRGDSHPATTRAENPADERLKVQT
jgi:hypothetical protein